jgi:hypothetical protein
MFGGQDDNAATAPAGGRPGQDDTLSGVTDLAGDPAASPDNGATDDKPADGGFMPAPSEPAQASVPEPHAEAEDVVAGDSPAPAEPAPAPAANEEELLNLKQQALQQLTPLVGHLDQTPEEKFRTTMMLIQASDNQDLLKDAYEAAQQIDDEKVRAQALLDVINEINYFSQSKQDN